MKLRLIYSDSEVEELIRQARTGDKGARGRLWEGFQDSLYRHCHWKNRSELQAKIADEDLMQEILVTAEQAFSEFRGNSRMELDRWLTGVARNVINRVYRHHRCGKRNLAREVPLDAFGENGERLPGRPEIEHLKEEETVDVKLAINRLGEKTMQIIWFHDYSGISFDQLAGDFRCSPSSVRRRREQALIRLKEIIEESEIAEGYRMA
jgi:RNA polymerase sigma factor (sigma-70 family)